MQLESGSIVAGRYRLERPLAQGAMGCVWVARHLQLGVDVAIKVMAPSYAESTEARARFEREAKVSAILQVPNAVRVHDYGIEEGSPFLVMELLEGEDLAARLRSRGRLSLAETLAVLEPVGKALRRAHELGLVHRDLKPGNVFMAMQGGEEIVKVVDFGIAKASAGLGLDAHATKTGSLLGSPRYMSPEQIRTSNHVDHRSDLWALGIIAFECTTGQSPFAGEEVGEVLVEVCTAPIPRASAVAPGLGPEVDRFFDRALLRDPAQRFQTASELVEAFAAVVNVAPQPVVWPEASHTAPPAGVGTLSPAASTFGPPTAPSRGGRAVIGVISALGGALLLGAILVVFFVTRSPASGSSPAPPAAPTAEPASLPTAASAEPTNLPTAASATPPPPATTPAPSASASGDAKVQIPIHPGARGTTSPKKQNDLLNHM